MLLVQHKGCSFLTEYTNVYCLDCSIYRSAQIRCLSSMGCVVCMLPLVYGIKSCLSTSTSYELIAGQHAGNGSIYKAG